jgi:G3E family GTPase
MTQLILIMGFLGSGKTTLLEKILSDTSERVGVVVNEFGSVSVDGERLKLNNNIDIMEVNSGSIFCACKVDFFIKSVYKLIDMGISKIYVEASGLSNPSSITKIMDDLNTLKKTTNEIKVKTCISVTDAERIAILLKASVAALSQVQRANVILLNKIDNVNEETKNKAIDAIKEINGIAQIIPCVMCDVDINKITETVDEELNLECIDPKPISERSFVIKQSKSLEKRKFDLFIEKLIPFCLRIKGFVTLEDKKHYVDMVSAHIKIEECSDEKPDELVIIVYEDEKETANKQIEEIWENVFSEKSPEIMV